MFSQKKLFNDRILLLTFKLLSSIVELGLVVRCVFLEDWWHLYKS